MPLASRQREIEREIDELDRGVQLGALVLILLGAAIGYWMAERIGDPVQRLTRATRRIAAGDLTARVIVKTADELQRLVEAFNKMAGELQRQRQQLERTHRLEAWAEMARQVAHDIKNPLTPIQLSAEHLRRVNQDRGQPLSPVLDNCVDTILTQVRLLRQIASEFSSFGTSPTVTLAPTAVRDLVDEVIDPYRAGDRRPHHVRSGSARRSARDDDRPHADGPRHHQHRRKRAVCDAVGRRAVIAGARGAVEQRRPDGRHAVELRIIDTGFGMDEEAARRIFEPYFSTKATGTGLGLSIARRNVELHGGTINVASQKGVGTTVTIAWCRSRTPRSRFQRLNRSDSVCPHPEGGVTRRWTYAAGSPRPMRARPRRPSRPPPARPRAGGRWDGGASGPHVAEQAGQQVGVGHRHQRDLRMRGDGGDDQRHDHQVAVRAARAEIERLEAAIADGADHQERRHQHHRQRQHRPPVLQAVGIREDRRGGHARRSRARHPDEVALVGGSALWMLKRARRIAAAET